MGRVGPDLPKRAWMSYLVLARKWRPRRFAELVGQEHVVRALSNAPWSEKRKALHQFRTLLLNARLIDEYPERFDDDAIDERGAHLADRVLSIWPGPDAW